MFRYSRFVRSMILTAIITASGRVAVSDELFQGYEVQVGYAGPVYFQSTSTNQNDIRNREFDNPHPNATDPKTVWTFGLTPREFLAKVSPNLEPDSIPLVTITRIQSGNYALGSVFPRNEDLSYDDSRATRLFVTDGTEFRSSQTNSALDIVDYVLSSEPLINEKGQFVFRDQGKSYFYDFATDTKTAIPDLGLGSNEFVSPLGMNNDGTVVGTVTAYDAQGKFVRHAFRYSNGVMTDLNDLVMLNDELVINFAFDLTETGEIIGRMANTWSGQEDWVKLTPAMVPEPSSLWIGLAGIAAAAWKFRRDRQTTTG